MFRNKCLDCVFVEMDGDKVVGCVMEHTYYLKGSNTCPDRMDTEVSGELDPSGFGELTGFGELNPSGFGELTGFGELNPSGFGELG